MYFSICQKGQKIDTVTLGPMTGLLRWQFCCLPFSDHLSSVQHSSSFSNFPFCLLFFSSFPLYIFDASVPFVRFLVSDLILYWLPPFFPIVSIHLSFIYTHILARLETRHKRKKKKKHHESTASRPILHTSSSTK